MRSILTKIPPKPLLKRILTSPISISTRSLSTQTQTQTRTRNLEKIADELLTLNPIDLHNYTILFRLKMGLQNSSAAASLSSAAAPSSAAASASAAEKPAEKTVFDIKLEKFDAGAKIKIIKEVRTFTELGLKEAKDLVEKSPVVVKKGVTKEEGNAIVEKLKVLGATVVLE